MQEYPMVRWECEKREHSSHLIRKTEKWTPFFGILDMSYSYSVLVWKGSNHENFKCNSLFALFFLVLKEKVSYSTVGNVSFDTKQICLSLPLCTLPFPPLPLSFSLFSVSYFKGFLQFYHEEFFQRSVFDSSDEPKRICAALLNIFKVLF